MADNIPSQQPEDYEEQLRQAIAQRGLAELISPRKERGVLSRALSGLASGFLESPSTPASPNIGVGGTYGFLRGLASGFKRESDRPDAERKKSLEQAKGYSEALKGMRPRFTEEELDLKRAQAEASRARADYYTKKGQKVDPISVITSPGDQLLWMQAAGAAASSNYLTSMRAQEMLDVLARKYGMTRAVPGQQQPGSIFMQQPQTQPEQQSDKARLVIEKFTQ